MMMKKRTQMPKRNCRVQKSYLFDNRIEFISVQDHILESVCSCEVAATSSSTPTTIPKIETTGILEEQPTQSSGDPSFVVEKNKQFCQVCKYEKELPIPHLPEMIFSQNCLKLRLIQSSTTTNHKCDGNFPNPDDLMLEFNAFDALNHVQVGKLPDVKVGPSSVWQEARKSLPVRDFQQPFDWTYTSEYAGTLGPALRMTEEPSVERINFEKLKQREPILFYDQITLYEDELADHGESQMSVRIRVMPNSFFILCRFYLRVDHVMVRICDTRFYGESHKNYLLREWSKREALYSQLSKEDIQHKVLDANLIYESLPETEFRSAKLQY